MTVFPLDDDYSFGILQSGIHWLWFTERCSTLKSDPRYTSNSVFDSFPWPQGPRLDAVENVAAAAVQLRRLRRELMDRHNLSLRELYRALELPGASPLKEAQEALDGQAGRALECLTEGFEAATAVLALPAKYRKRLRTTNMLERFIGDASSPEEIRRREKGVRIFPNERSAWRLVGALAAEQHEAWCTRRGARVGGTW